MNTKKLSDLLNEVENRRKELKILLIEQESLSLNGTQSMISVAVGQRSRQITITHMDRSTGWESRLVRGSEMILLGVKKAYAVMVDEAKANVELAESAVRSEAINRGAA